MSNELEIEVSELVESDVIVALDIKVQGEGTQ